MQPRRMYNESSRILECYDWHDEGGNMIDTDDEGGNMIDTTKAVLTLYHWLAPVYMHDRVSWW